MNTASQLRDENPNMDTMRCNRYRWPLRDNQESTRYAMLGTITNWLGDRNALTCNDLDHLLSVLHLPPFKVRQNRLSLREKQFVSELMLIFKHALDTIDYLGNKLGCDQVIDLTHVAYVFHENGHVPETFIDVLKDVNDVSYKVLLPLFFTKQLYVHRSRMLAKLRRELRRLRSKQIRVLSGDVVCDSRRMRCIDPEVSEAVRQVASKVCVSDLVNDEASNMAHTYGEFPEFTRAEICGMPSGEIRIFYPKTVNYKVDHILNNFGNRVYRTRLDKSLKPDNDNVIVAASDVLATHALAREAVVYTNDPAWGEELIGGVEQPIIGGYQKSRHKLLAFLGLLNLLCSGAEEEAKMQDSLLKKVVYTDSDPLKAEIMEFVERRVIQRKSNGIIIRASEVLNSAFSMSENKLDSAVVAREMFHFLVADHGKMVPEVREEEKNDGCYFKTLYQERIHGNAELLVDVAVPMAGLSTTQKNYNQLYTQDGRVLKSTIDLRTSSSSILHISEGGDERAFASYPVVVNGDLSAG